jgi:hypothetical protein
MCDTIKYTSYVDTSISTDSDILEVCIDTLATVLPICCKSCKFVLSHLDFVV